MITEINHNRRLFMRNLKALGMDVHGQMQLVDILMLADEIEIEPSISWEGDSEDPWKMVFNISTSESNTPTIVRAKNSNDLIRNMHTLITNRPMYFHSDIGIHTYKFDKKRKAWDKT